MPRYLVQRTFPEGLEIPIDHERRRDLRQGGGRQRRHGVTWIHSYVSPDHHTTFCIYDGPDPDSIRAAAETNGLPGGHASPRSQVLDPYFYH